MLRWTLPLLVLPVLALNSFATSAAVADELRPIAAAQTQLGDASVSTYYVPTSRGFRVVTTTQIATGGTQAVLRYVTTLAPGQETIISVPHAEGTSPDALRIARVGDSLQIERIGALTE